MIYPKEGFGVKGGPRTLQIILVFTLTRPKTFTQGRVNASDKYLHWPCVGVKNTCIHCNRISVSVNFFDVFTLIGDLHAVYTAIDTYMHKTGLEQWWVVLTRWLKTNGSFQSSCSENWHENRHETRIEGSH
jgi:hypothetical protein